MQKPPTQTQLVKMRKMAKAAVREGRSTYLDELDRLAVTEGYPSWRELLAASKKSPTAKKPSGWLEEGPPYTLPVDPPLRRGFDNTPNEDRTERELAQWWNRPFAITREDGRLMVRCLDGGAWDRSTNYGIAVNLEAAIDLARRKLSEWIAINEQPIAMYQGDGTVQAVHMPLLPNQAPQPLSEPMPPEDFRKWVSEWESKRGS